MIEVRYVSSNGREYNLITDHIRPTSGTFHSYEWKANEAEIENGTEVYAWTKDPITYQITVTVRGSISERKRILNELTSAFEYDIANISPGRLYFDEYYIECFSKSGENTVSDTAITRSDFKINLYCPYAFWIKEETKSFFKDESKNSEYEYLAYPYGYSYDYSKPGQGAENWYINHHRNSHFKMVVYGPCANPRIMIGDHIYEVRDILENDEYAVISSKSKSVEKYLANGTKQNIFYRRGTEQSVFEQIPPGNLQIHWNGEFGFDLILYKERSVPEWN